MEEAGVSSEAVAEYLPRIESFARRFHGKGGAEYDDLVQEGSLKVFLLIRDDKEVSNTAIKNAMRDWVRTCYRRGFAEPSTDEDLDSRATSAPGHRKEFWSTEEGSERGGWVALGYAPETA